MFLKQIEDLQGSVLAEALIEFINGLRPQEMNLVRLKDVGSKRNLKFCVTKLKIDDGIDIEVANGGIHLEDPAEHPFLLSDEGYVDAIDFLKIALEKSEAEEALEETLSKRVMATENIAGREF